MLEKANRRDRVRSLYTRLSEYEYTFSSATNSYLN